MAIQRKCPKCGVFFPAYEDHECSGFGAQNAASKAFTRTPITLTKKPDHLHSECSVTPALQRGRPLNSQRHLTNEAQKPWEALGMCRATWYRRQKDKQEQVDK
jgi:hypothetical protein